MFRLPFGNRPERQFATGDIDRRDHRYASFGVAIEKARNIFIPPGELL
jgi:hypothetical protein